MRRTSRIAAGRASVEPFGAALHVRVAEGGPDAAALAGELVRRGFSGSGVADAEVTLEDVFLAVVGGASVNLAARRTLAISHKEILHIIRDVRVLYLALGLPVVMLLLFGYGISTDVDHIQIAVVDQDHTRASRRLVEGLVAGGQFVVARSTRERRRLRAALPPWPRRRLAGDPTRLPAPPPAGRAGRRATPRRRRG